MRVLRIAVIMVLGAWAGCVDSSNGGVMSTDSPASRLSIEPTIDDTDPMPADGMVSVVVKFFQSNEYVRLNSATVSINGVAIPYSTSGYATRIPVVSSGGAIAFKHVQSGVTTEFTYTVPPRPTVTAPAANELIPRTANLMIDYVSANGHAVRPTAKDASFSTTGIEQSDNGMAFLDVSGLRIGAGSVSVARRYVTTPSGTGFGGATITYTIASLPTPVTWQ